MNDILVDFLIYGVVPIGVGVYSLVRMIAFDDEIREIYRTDSSQWRALGRPAGYFLRLRRGKDVEAFPSTFARDALFLRFLFRRDCLRAKPKPKLKESLGEHRIPDGTIPDTPPPNRGDPKLEK